MKHSRFAGPMERHWDSDFFLFRSIKNEETPNIQKRSYKLHQRSQLFVKVSVCLLIWGYLLVGWVLICLAIGLNFLGVCIFSTFRILNTHYLGE